VGNHENLETFKALILERDLPRTEVALYGVKCPYCGKSDRIHRLEPPEELAAVLDSEFLQEYADLWQRLNPSDATLAMCKFCLYPVELAVDRGLAKIIVSS